MGYTISYKPHIGQGLGTRAYIGWCGNNQDAMYVHLSADGCVALHNPKGYLYPAEARAIHQAMGKLMDDYESERKAKLKKWLRDTADLKKHYGSPVDLSRTETIAALEQSPCRNTNGRPEIFFRGAWRTLYRTDLKDDVGTYCDRDSFETYSHKAKTSFGARLKDDAFGIVDALSDG